jgi:hypothetical protein
LNGYDQPHPGPGSTGTTASCRCPCHHEPKRVVRCCVCYTKGKDPCECKEKRRCCGDPVPPRRPRAPEPPGWRPGARPPPNPLAGAVNDADLHRRFRSAIIDLLRTGGGRAGPPFGPRKTEFLPYLVVRANAGDRGARPLTVPFWESPDIFVAPNLDAQTAPAVPTTHAGLAQAGAPNTLWAHVWNLGLAPVANARVEFWFIAPVAGVDPSWQLIGVTHVDLDDRFSGTAHTIVKCPTTWVPPFVNGGHECLLVRCFDPLTDPLGPSPFNAIVDRHVAQRNITVIDATSPAILTLPLRLGCGAPQGSATVTVGPVRADLVGWLTKLAGAGQRLQDAPGVNEIIGLLGPTPVQRRETPPDLGELPANVAGRLLRRRIDFERGCDELEVLLYVFVDGLQPGQCRIYRVQQTMGNSLIGGYTVIARRQ